MIEHVKHAKECAQMGRDLSSLRSLSVGLIAAMVSDTRQAKDAFSQWEAFNEMAFANPADSTIREMEQLASDHLTKSLTNPKL